MKQLIQKRKDRSKMRQFTRQDVVNCFDQFWGAAFRADDSTVTVQDIALLSGTTPPTWRIDHCLNSPAATFGFHYHDAVLFMHHSWTTPSGRQKWYLTAPQSKTCR